MWRIIGVFKNSSGDWNLKLIRNTILTSDELPSTYTYNGTSFRIRSTNGGNYVIWNSTKTATNYNDWTTASLQYWLNGSDGYFGTLSSGAQALVDKTYTYYLGNVGVYTTPEQDTTISAYNNERGSIVCSSNITENTHTNNCNIWYGNKATWSGKVALLYPSDYGYSSNSSCWTRALYGYSNGCQNKSWIFESFNISDIEWLLSPASHRLEYATELSPAGFIRNGRSASGYNNENGARPVLNLLASASIDANHTGSSSDPYIIIE